jgi:hypothetical protein
MDELGRDENSETGILCCVFGTRDGRWKIIDGRWEACRADGIKAGVKRSENPGVFVGY